MALAVVSLALAPTAVADGAEASEPPGDGPTTSSTLVAENDTDPPGSTCRPHCH